MPASFVAYNPKKDFLAKGEPGIIQTASGHQSGTPSPVWNLGLVGENVPTVEAAVWTIWG